MRWVCMIFMVFLGYCSVGECGTGVYGKPVKYSLNAEVRYPDFAVRFVGTRREFPKVYPRGFLYYDFEVLSNNGTKVKASWTSGTGVLGPIEFSVDGERYSLELKGNSLETDSKKKRLKEDEMIIWRKEVYLKKQEEIRKIRE